MASTDCEIIGIDEVGRGCLAGPLLVVAARAKGQLPSGLTDSKKLSRSRREGFYDDLIKYCDFGEGWVSAKEINSLGLTKATRLAVKRALASLGARTDDPIIMDGNFNYCPTKYKRASTQVKADLNVPIVSAASILAKVKRDRYMMNLPKRYSGYGFENHVGYSTKLHLEAIREMGPISNFHRSFYAPIRFAEREI